MLPTSYTNSSSNRNLTDAKSKFRSASQVKTDLIEGLKLIPESWALTPVNENKEPYRKIWQAEPPLTRQELIREIQSGAAKGYGLRTGSWSDGIVALDADGEPAHQLALQFSRGQPIPRTVAFTSNKPGRCQYLFFVPPERREGLKTRRYFTGKLDPQTGKKIYLEFRPDRCQSVLPPSVHPDTGEYRWVNSPLDTEIAQAPDWVIEKMQKEKPVNPSNPLEKIHLPVDQSVPLLACLTHRSRDMLASGAPAPDKGRNDSGAELSRDLIGAATYLDKLGQRYSGNPMKLFFDWCRDCSLDSDQPKGQPETIWNSARNYRPEPGIGSVAVENCIKSWYWNHFLKPNRSHGGGNKPTTHAKSKTTTKPQSKTTTKPQPKTTTTSDSKPTPPLSFQQAASLARQLLAQELDELTLNSKLEEIRLECGMSDYSFDHKILRPLKRDLRKQRQQFDLLALLQTEDEVSQLDAIHDFAIKYGQPVSLIERKLKATKRKTETALANPTNLDQFFEQGSEPLDWLLPGWLPKGETAILAGPPKAGKTLLALDAAFCVATGETHFLGEKVKQGKVLLICPDSSANSLRNQLLTRGFRKEDSAHVRVITQWDISQRQVLEQELEQFRPDLVVIDSLRRINKGSEISENSAEFADNIYSLKELLGRYRAAGILVHHTSKSQDNAGVYQLRGSSAIAGSVWGIWTLNNITKPDKQNKKRLVVDPRDPNRSLELYARDSEGSLLKVRLNPENLSWENLGSGDPEGEKERLTQCERVKQLLDQNSHRELSGIETIKLLGESPDTGRWVYTVLQRLAVRKQIRSRPAPVGRGTLYSSIQYQNCLLAPSHLGNNNNTLQCKEKLKDPLKTTSPPPSPQVDLNVELNSKTPNFFGGESIQQSIQHSTLQPFNPAQKKLGVNKSESVEPSAIEQLFNTLQLLEGGGSKGEFCKEANLSTVFDNTRIQAERLVLPSVLRFHTPIAENVHPGEGMLIPPQRIESELVAASSLEEFHPQGIENVESNGEEQKGMEEKKEINSLTDVEAGSTPPKAEKRDQEVESLQEERLDGTVNNSKEESSQRAVGEEKLYRVISYTFTKNPLPDLVEPCRLVKDYGINKEFIHIPTGRKVYSDETRMEPFEYDF